MKIKTYLSCHHQVSTFSQLKIPKSKKTTTETSRQSVLYLQRSAIRLKSGGPKIQGNQRIAGWKSPFFEGSIYIYICVNIGVISLKHTYVDIYIHIFVYLELYAIN